MNAVPLQIPGVTEHVIARDQAEYIALSAASIVMELPDGTPVPGILTRWRPTDEERAQLAAGADVWLETMTFGEPLQPIRLSVECPIEPVAQG